MKVNNIYLFYPIFIIGRLIKLVARFSLSHSATGADEEVSFALQILRTVRYEHIDQAAQQLRGRVHMR